MVANTIVLYTFDKFPIDSIARFKSTSFIIYRNISSFNFVKQDEGTVIIVLTGEGVDVD